MFHAVKSILIDMRKSLHLHTWWGINLSERLLNTIYSENRPIPATEINNEEGCMAYLRPKLWVTILIKFIEK